MDAKALNGEGGDEDYSQIPHGRNPSKQAFLLHASLHPVRLVPCPPEGKFLGEPFQKIPVNGYLHIIIAQRQGNIVEEGKMVKHGIYHGDRPPAGEMEDGKNQHVVSRGKEVFHYLPKRMEA
jgi:hypothetical protein